VRVPLLSESTTFGACFKRLDERRRKVALPRPVTFLASFVPETRAVPANVSPGTTVLIVQVIERPLPESSQLMRTLRVGPGGPAGPAGPAGPGAPSAPRGRAGP